MNIKKIQEINSPYLTNKYEEMIKAYIELGKAVNKINKLVDSTMFLDLEMMEKGFRGDAPVDLSFNSFTTLVADRLTNLGIISTCAFERLLDGTESIKKIDEDNIIYSYKYGLKELDKETRKQENELLVEAMERLIKDFDTSKFNSEEELKEFRDKIEKVNSIEDMISIILKHKEN